MHYFAVQVWTGREQDYVRHFQTCQTSPEACRCLIPTRRLNIRKQGRVKPVEKPIFPGYIFLEHEEALLARELRWQLRSIPHFIRLLPETSQPKPLEEKDRQLLSHFITLHKPADISKVYFDEDDRIVVLEGPLKGLEGRIIKVNKRKGRVKIVLDMCGSAFTLDLGFEIIERQKKGSGDQHDKQ